MSDITRIDGKAVAAEVIEECRAEVARLKADGIEPGLAVVLVGEDPASKVYVGSKVRTCGELGIHSRRVDLPADVAEEEGGGCGVGGRAGAPRPGPTEWAAARAAMS